MLERKDWRVFRWDFIKGLASNDFTRVVVLIPLAGYLILFNDEIAKLASFDLLAGANHNHTPRFLIEGLTKLRLVFFGSLSILCSLVVYRLFRPNEVDMCKSDLEFSEVVIQRYSVHDLQELEEGIYSPSWPKRTIAFWIIFDSERPAVKVVSGYRPDVREHMLSNHADYIRLLAREWWSGMMHTYRPARIFSIVFAVAGYLMLAIPTFDIAQAVLRSIFLS